MRIRLNEDPSAITEALVEKIEEQRTEIAGVREDNYRLMAENLTLRATLACLYVVRKGECVESEIRRN